MCWLLCTSAAGLPLLPPHPEIAGTSGKTPPGGARKSHHITGYRIRTANII